ncbi:hypothetical protein ACQJBY_024702 [Aegilops geniculata]
MAGVLVQASLVGFRPLIGKLADLLGGEYNLLTRVRKEITFLHLELSSMDALLRTLADNAEIDAQTSERGSRVRDLSCGIEDCIDVFIHHLGRGDADEGFMRGVADMIGKLRARHQIGKRIKALQARVIEEAKRTKRYSLDHGDPASASISMGRRPESSSVDARLSALYGEAGGLVGIDRPRDKIIRLLDGKEKELKAVSVVGFGGLGKTTLAMEVYRKIGAKFQCRASSSISSTPDIKRLMKDILSQVNPAEFRRSETWEKEQLIRKVTECLRHKRYLIVIDDIWSTEAWNSIQHVFPRNDLGSRIIATTRIENVAAACCNYRHDSVYKIEHLNNQDSRRLFFRRVFGTEDTCPVHFEKISDEILKKCGGAPLAIISIASMLASQQVMLRTKWEIVLSSLGSMLEKDPALRWMSHVLNLSYNDLPYDLKTCMLYLATFPEDSIIRKDHLLRRWIAEGFVMEIPGQDLEDVAEGYLTELINRSMIQPASFSEGGELMSVRVHDLMLELITSKSRQENFITTISDLKAKPGALEIRRLSLHFSNADNVLGGMELKQTRSLIFSGIVQDIPSIRKFELVRVMDLEASFSRNISCDLTGICRLFLLRYLRIRGNSFRLPDQMRTLKHLKTLELNGSLLNVPSDVFELQSLSHLIVPGNAELPDGLGNMRALRTLRALDVAGCPMDRLRALGELTNLRDLQLSYQIHRADEDPDAERKEALVTSLVKLGSSCNLRSLAFSPYSWRMPADVLSHWEPAPQSLESLHLLMCPFSAVPGWIASLDSLTRLGLRVHMLQKDGVEIIGKLPSLVDLQFSVHSVPEQRIIIAAGWFPAITNFAFHHDKPCLSFEPEAMQKLQKLSLECRASKLKRREDLPSGVEHLSSLEQVFVYHDLLPESIHHIMHHMKTVIGKHAGHPSLEIKEARGVIEVYMGGWA